MFIDNLKHTRLFFSGFIWLIAILLSSPTFCAQTSDTHDTKTKIKKLTSLKIEINKIHSIIRQLNSQHNNHLNTIKKLDEMIGQLALKIENSQQTIQENNLQLIKLKKLSPPLLKNIHILKQQLATLFRAAYITGRQERLKLLLNQEKPGKISRSMTYYQYYNRSRIEKLKALKQYINKIKQLEKKIRQKTRQLTTLTHKLNTEQQQLLQHKQQRLQKLVRLKQKIQHQGKKLKNLKQDKKQIKAMVQLLEKELSDIEIDDTNNKPFSQLKGALPWPIERHHFNKILLQSHKDDLIIKAHEGTKIKAIAHGRIEVANYLYGFGHMIVINHGDGYRSLYAYNQTLLKEVGEWVNTGEIIANVGMSGGQEQPGLYFGIRHNTDTLNPDKWCQHE